MATDQQGLHRELASCPAGANQQQPLAWFRLTRHDGGVAAFGVDPLPLTSTTVPRKATFLRNRGEVAGSVFQNMTMSPSSFVLVLCRSGDLDLASITAEVVEASGTTAVSIKVTMMALTMIVHRR